jgi:hypothetical protein
MLGNGPLEGLINKLLDARKKGFGGSWSNFPFDGWLDDIAKGLGFLENPKTFQALIVMGI